jgi:hypothetical protein
MVGGGYQGFVTYCPYAFDLDYFLPGGPSSDAARAGSGDEAAVPDGIDIVGLPTEVSLQDSDLLGEAGEASAETAAEILSAEAAEGRRNRKPSVPAAVVLDPVVEDEGFNIISLRTSGY